MTQPTPEILTELRNLYTEQEEKKSECLCEHEEVKNETCSDSRNYFVWEDEWDNLHGDIFLFI